LIRLKKGLKLKRINKKSSPDYPLISIITVCLNNGQSLEKTIKSVINQTYSNIEYIIIDGGSTDNTINTIKKYESKIDHWLSESDKGIYDAMNKGISLAKGKWINFMNAGDKFYSRNTIEQIFTKKIEGFDFIYGDCEIIYNSEFSRLQKAGDTKNLWKGMVFSHQSLFTGSDVFKKHRFNIENRIGADFEFLFKCYKNNLSFYNCHIPIAKISAGGISDTSRVESIFSRRLMVNNYSKNLKVNAYYLILFIDAFIRLGIKKMLPDRIHKFLLKKKYKSF